MNPGKIIILNPDVLFKDEFWYERYEYELSADGNHSLTIYFNNYKELWIPFKKELKQNQLLKMTKTHLKNYSDIYSCNIPLDFQSEDSNERFFKPK